MMPPPAGYEWLYFRILYLSTYSRWNYWKRRLVNISLLKVPKHKNNFLYVAESIKLYNMLIFHQILFSGLNIAMVHKTLAWNLWYDPKQHRILFITGPIKFNSKNKTPEMISSPRSRVNTGPPSGVIVKSGYQG